ncbi:MAG TPA: SH3 domain-containing protein, partial [Candidatus Binatia bacterium]
NKRGWAGVTIAVVLTVIVLAGTILYTQQSGSLAALGVNIDDLVNVRWNPARFRARDNGDEKNVSLLADIPHFQMTSSQASEFLTNTPTGDGIASPARKDYQQAETAPAKVESQSSENETTSSPQKIDTKTKVKERTYRVYDASFVRDKPRSDANITGMLEPGTRIKIQTKTGDYFRVRSLDGDPISGYVHREDAFFEPLK